MSFISYSCLHCRLGRFPFLGSLRRDCDYCPRNLFLNRDKAERRKGVKLRGLGNAYCQLSAYGYMRTHTTPSGRSRN